MVKNKKIIDICDISTYPKDLLMKFKSEKCNDNDIENNIEDYYSMIKDYNILCFHFTRLLSAKEVLDNGLKRFDKDETVERVIKEYKKMYKNDHECEIIKKEADIWISQYNNGEKDNSKQGQLCFVIGKNKKLSNYSSLYCMFGGELISNFTKKYEFHKKLMNIGESYCVSFKIPISYVKKYQRGTLLESIIKIMLSNYRNNKDNNLDGKLYNIDIRKDFIISVEKTNKTYM